MSTEISRRSKGMYHQLYLSKVDAAIQICRSLASLSHAAEKGRLREVLVRSMFRPLLPADLGVGTGFVIASDGRQSSQQDIVLYDRSTLPPALVDDETGVFPVESVLYTIEVKSTLTRRDLELSHQNAKSIASFTLLGKDSKPTTQGPRPDATIFALSSDLDEGGKGEVDRYAEVRGSDPPYLSAICVVGRGYWWFSDGQFRRWPERYDFAEVMGYLGGVMNKVPQLYEERRARRPAYGAYLIDFGADFSALLKDLIELQTRVRSSAQRGEQGRPEIKSASDELQTLHSRLVEVTKAYDEYHDDKMTLLLQKLQQLHDEIASMIQTTLHVLESVTQAL